MKLLIISNIILLVIIVFCAVIFKYKEHFNYGYNAKLAMGGCPNKYQRASQNSNCKNIPNIRTDCLSKYNAKFTGNLIIGSNPPAVDASTIDCCVVANNVNSSCAYKL
jgi:hypothetical protein